MGKLNLLCIILVLIILFSLLFPYKVREYYTQIEDSAEYGTDESNPLAFGPESDQDNTSNWDDSIYKNLPKNIAVEFNNPNRAFADISSEKATENLILDEKFAEEHPKLYNKILDIVLKSYMNNPDDFEYTLKIKNRTGDGSYSNLVNHITTMSPENRHKIKQMIMEENPSAGDCSLTYPHPSYAILNQFKSMSTCNQNCDKKTETGTGTACLPVAANCYVSKI